jgi:uncharacterized membrane protein
MDTSIIPLPESPTRKPFWAWLRDRFLAGLFAVLPLVLTYWIISFVYNLVNGPADRVIRRLVADHLLPGSTYFIEHQGGTVPGGGFIVTLLLILLVGIVVGNFLGQKIFALLDEILLRIPVIKGIYQALRQAIQAVQQMGDENGGSRFRQVAYVVLPGSEARIFGFVTGHFTGANGAPFTSLFIPNAPSVMAGFVLVVPDDKVTLAPDFTVEQIMKMTVSLGLIPPGTAK